MERGCMMFQAGVFPAATDPQLCEACGHYGATVVLNFDGSDLPPLEYRPKAFFFHEACLWSRVIGIRRDTQGRRATMRYNVEQQTRERTEWEGLKAAYEQRLAEHEAVFQAKRQVVIQQTLTGQWEWQEGER